MNKTLLFAWIILLATNPLFSDEKPMAYAVNGDLITDPYKGYVDDGWWHIDRSIKTPCQNFAKPYVEGSINVLLIAPFQDARTAVELEQRFDFKVDMFMTAGYEKPWTKNDYWIRRPFLKPFKKQEAKQLDVDKYDVIVLGGINWDNMFFDIKYKVLKAASEGKGLVMIPYKKGKHSDIDTSLILKEVFSKPVSDNNYIIEGVPFEMMRGFGIPHRRNAKIRKPEDVVKTFSFKKGRAIILNYKPIMKGLLAPVRAHSDFMFDFYQALLGRAIIWASGKTPPVRIIKTSLDNIKTVKQNEFKTIKIDFENLKSSENYSVEIITRVNDKKYSKTISKSNQPIKIKEGVSEVTLVCPELPAGETAIDIFIKTTPSLIQGVFGGKETIVDWCSRIVNVERIERYISEIIEPDKIHEINDVVPLTLKMAGSPQDNLQLDVCCSDVYGRIVRKEIIDVKNQSEIKIDIPLKRVIGNQVWVTLMLKTDHKIAQFLTKRVFRADTSRPDFLTLAWCGGFYVDDNTPWSRGAYRTLKESGINTVQPPLVFWQDSPNINDRGIMAADVGLKVSPMICSIRGQKNPVGPVPKDNIGKGGFTDINVFTKQVAQTVKIAKEYAKIGSVVYNIGDENGLHFSRETDLCRRPETLKDFRKTLQTRYKTLDDLNKEWKTSFKQWEDVVPDTLKQAGKRGCYSSWADFRDYMEDALANAHVKVKQAMIRSGIKHPETGIDGLSDFRHGLGHDVTKLPRAVNEISPYDKNLSLALVRDMNPDRHVSVNKGVYSSRTGSFDGALWEALGRGAMSSLFWNVYVGQNWTYGIMPDLRPSVPLATYGKDSQSLNRGPARLIDKSKMVYNPVAVFYSRPSIRAANFIDKGLGKVYSSMRVMVPGTSEYFGLNPKFIDNKTLCDDSKMRSFKVLVLPYTQAISDREAKAIKRFVSSGGTVIADARPGIFSEHCGKRTSAILDDLFGIEQKPVSAPVRETTNVEWFDSTALEKQKVDSMLQDAAISGGVVKKKKQAFLVADAGLKLNDGKAEMTLGETKIPIIIRHRYGKGEAILLNLKNVPEILPLWEMLMKQAGITYPVRAFSKSGKELHQFRYSVFENGEAMYVMLFEGPDCPATVKLPKKAYGYNTRRREFLGNTDTINVSTLKMPWMLALLPAKTISLQVTLPEEISQGADLCGTFKMIFKPNTKCFHVACIRIFNQDDVELQYYQQLVNTEDGNGTFSIPLALNETPGTYTIRVTDAATGVNGQQTVQVHPREGK